MIAYGTYVYNTLFLATQTTLFDKGASDSVQ